MVLMPVLCPHCHSDQVIKGGKTKTGTQRYKCENADCPRYSFQLHLTYKGRLPEIKEQVGPPGASSLKFTVSSKWSVLKELEGQKNIGNMISMGHMRSHHTGYIQWSPA